MVLVSKSDHGRRRSFVRDAAMFATAFVLGYGVKMASNGSSTQAAPKSYAGPRPWPSEKNDRNSIQPPLDPHLEPLDCIQLLDSYRRKEVPQLAEHVDGFPIHKSYARLTSTKIPFYVTTNDGKIDRMRVSLFETGDYYETAMTSAFQAILDDQLHWLKKAGRKRPIVLDVGGNVGWFSLLAAAHDAEVFTFEPNVVNMVRFCESLALNGWASSPNPAKNRVHPFLKGVSNGHGTKQAMYKVDPQNPGSFSFSKETADADGERYYGKAGMLEGEPLQLISLDALAQDQGWLATNGGTGGAPISILKVDVEGLELKVLQGARRLLKSGRIKNIFLELKDTEGMNYWESMLSILLEAGYELYKLGDHLGPTEVVTTRVREGREAADYISRAGFTNANIWLRLVK